MMDDDMAESPRELSEAQKRWADVVSGMRQAAVERFNVRRDLEWRVSLTLWGGLVIAANALRSEDLKPGWHWKWVLVLVGAVLVAVLHLVWEGANVGPAARRDRDDGVHLDRELRQLVGVKQPDVKDYRGWVAHRWQVGVTILLGAFLMVAVTR